METNAKPLRTLTPEEEAEVVRKLDEICGPIPRPRPKAVVREHAVVRDADVSVSRADPNAGGVARVVSVRRDDWVTVNMAEYERQRAERERDGEHLRRLDPFGLGHWR